MGATSRGTMAGKILVFLQFGFIVLLVYALSSEYAANANQQQWISDNVWWLQYFLNGYLAAGLIGIFIGGAFLLVGDYLRNRNKRGTLKTVA